MAVCMNLSNSYLSDLFSGRLKSFICAFLTLRLPWVHYLSLPTNSESESNYITALLHACFLHFSFSWGCNYITSASCMFSVTFNLLTLQLFHVHFLAALLQQSGSRCFVSRSFAFHIKHQKCPIATDTRNQMWQGHSNHLSQMRDHRWHLIWYYRPELSDPFWKMCKMLISNVRLSWDQVALTRLLHSLCQQSLPPPSSAWSPSDA